MLTRTMQTWKNRITTGEKCEAVFSNQVAKLGLGCEYTSQHRNYKSGRPGLARHFPDYRLPDLDLFVQVKDAQGSAPYKNVIAEERSYQACLGLVNAGKKCIMLWLMPDGEFLGNFVERLKPIGSISKDARQHGSGTPAVKFPKLQLVNFRDLVDRLQVQKSLPAAQNKDRHTLAK